MTPAPTVTAVLQEARRLIAERGWCQGEYEQDGCFCAMGALFQAAEWMTAGKVDSTSQKASKLITVAIGCLIPGAKFEAPVLKWNDDKRRSRNEVIAAFDRAIKRSQKAGPHDTY